MTERNENYGYQALLQRKKLLQDSLREVNRDIAIYRFADTIKPLPTELIRIRAMNEPTRPIYRAWDDWEEL